VKLHHLSVTAFGPFAGHETVDFEALNDAGLFLLTGPTGGGKTSILDAVCFALYGQVPGVRDAKELKSQHSPDDVVPEVVLDFSVAGQRFLLRRTPEWTRPKRRGDGVSRQQASASLSRVTAGEPVLLSSRVQEVGHEIADLVGMTLDQFEQVALLPQGGFQRFLRATSQERHDVLQQLFKTDRFTRIEEWVHDHSRELSARAQSCAADVRRMLDVVADRVGAEGPESLDDALAWVDHCLVETREQLAVSGLVDEQAMVALKSARAEAETARRVAAALERADQARATLVELEAEAAAPGQATSAEALRESERLTHRRLVRLEATLARLRSRDEALTAAASARLEADELEAGLAELTAASQSLPESIASVKRELDDDRVVCAGREPVAEALASARGRLEAAGRMPDDLATVAAALDALSEARERRLASGERLHALVARRLAGMAAELAAELATDVPCPVCGSTDHPSPTAPGADSVEPEEHEAAEAAYAAADLLVSSTSDALLDAERALSNTRQAAGGLDLPQAQRAARDAATRLAAVHEAEARHAANTKRLTALETRANRHDALRESLLTRRSALTEAVAGHERAAAAAELDVRAAWGEDALPDSMTDELSRLTGRLDDIKAALAAQAARDEAGATAKAVLADPAVAEALAAQAPDLAAADAAVTEVEERAAQAAAGTLRLRQVVSGVESVRGRLVVALEGWLAVRDEAERAAEMSRLVRGSGAHNLLQMRLSAYVLATRLDQVVAAANERLAHMRDHRYLLQRTGRAARRNAQAGLGLEVVDQWTGATRDPASLSGGETFVVSLALALGLADVVSDEAGGVDIQTLFVDEGFGSLDAETLDDVMDRLDGLRAGGRTVGVVSHVSEMRNRIPTQVHVEKRQDGSSVRVYTPAG